MKRLLLLIALAPLGCSTDPKPSPDPAPSQQAGPEAPSPVDSPAAGALTRVDPNLVCMINNQFMGTPQIAVDVEGTTYYGCCEMCKTKLANDPSSRSAIDPVSGATVDKAHAVIGKTETGAVVYFENEQNLAAYVKPAS
jgi:YHS domain-containing protein